MPVALYMDVHVPGQITEQLRRRAVDVRTAQDDGAETLLDAELLQHATSLGRPFTQDIRFKALAEEWQREGTTFAGLFFGHQIHGTIGAYVHDLEVIAKVSDPSDWVGRLEHLPYK